MHIKKHLAKPTKLGEELLVLPAILAHPDIYKLGRESAHMSCRCCGEQPRHWVDAQNIKDTGMCFRCDELSSEYAAEAKWDMERSMLESGLDPANPDDVDLFMEGGDYSW